jgi:hypothetical protein
MRIVVSSLIIVLLAAVPFNPTLNACDTYPCNASPCTGPEILYDVLFDQDCAWTRDSNAVRSCDSNGCMTSLSRGGHLSQDVYVPTGYSAHAVTINFSVTQGTSPGSEHLILRIVRPSDGTVLETIGSWSAYSSGGSLSFYIGAYGGQTVRIEALVSNGPLAGDSVFDIHGLYWWES